MAVLALAGCSSKDGGDPGKKSSNAPPASGAAPAAKPGATAPPAAAPTIDPCAFGSAVDDAFGKTFHGAPGEEAFPATGFYGECKYAGATADEVIAVRVFKLNRSMFDGEKKGATPVPGLGEDAYYHENPQAKSFRTVALKNGIEVVIDYGHPSVEAAKIAAAEQKLMSKLLDKL